MQPDIGAPDERQHTNYIRHIAQTGGLPVFAAASPDFYETYQSHQPPLYYLVATPIELITGPNDRAEKWGLRLVNVLFGALVVLGTFTGIRRFTGNEVVALFSAAFVGLMPMFLALSAAVTNDVLLFLIGTALMNLIGRAWERGWHLSECLVCGAVVGLGLLTKTTSLLFLPVAALGMFAIRDRRPRIGGVISAVALALLISLPWLIRNQNLYGDPLDIGAFRQASVGNLPYDVAVERLGGPLAYWFSFVAVCALQGIWGVFGYFDIAFPSAVYWTLAAFGAVALVGYFLRLRVSTGPERKFHWLALTMIFFVVLGFIAYNRSYFQVQGRYLYPGIFALASVAGFGLFGLAAGKETVFRKLASVWIAVLLMLDIYAVAWLLPVTFSVMEACK
jgi:4-amino-4-deoxy-L-arabinose transferase-like glycosyltransferase